MLDPGGPAARSIASLWWAMLAGATAIFALVAVLIALAWRRPGRAAAGAQEAHGDAARGDTAGEEAAGAAGERVWIHALGLAFPLVVLVALLAGGVWTGEQLLPREAREVVRVEAQAKRWTWTFAYADAPGRTTRNELHIPAGRPVDVAITTADVIHSFWVPRLAGKLDAIPGHVNVLRIAADAPGTYAGVSAEFSGPGYDGHVFTVIAHDAAGWAAFLAGGPAGAGREGGS